MKTLLIDDHSLFREGLALLMAHGFPQLTLLQAGDMAEALVLLEAHADVSLALLDLALPDCSGLSGLQHLREQAPQVMVVVLSADDSAATVLAAIDAGAAGFIPKTSRAGVMQAALKVVLAGGIYLPPEVLNTATATAAATAVAMAPACAEPDGVAPADTSRDDTLGLSPRQRDVLRLLVAGQPNKLICRTLALSESTVKTHLAAIFRRLDANSRTQAVVAAARLGLRLHEAPASH
jgi:DNA-binding NarL/FixJ family response regulator